MNRRTQTAEAPWPEAMATVTACKYEFGAGRALAFGVPMTKHFRISFNYWAPNSHGMAELHTGEFSSATAVPQGHLFPVRYNPENPHETNRSEAEPLARTPLLAIGIVGSVILSLLWLLILRGC